MTFDYLYTLRKEKGLSARLDISLEAFDNHNTNSMYSPRIYEHGYFRSYISHRLVDTLNSNVRT